MRSLSALLLAVAAALASSAAVADSKGLYTRPTWDQMERAVAAAQGVPYVPRPSRKTDPTFDQMERLIKALREGSGGGATNYVTWSDYAYATNTLGDHITGLETGKVSVGSLDGAASPLPPYLHEISFDDAYPEDAAWYYAQPQDYGGCSSVRDGGFLCRNYDWRLDDAAEFVVRMSAGPGRFASVGVANCGTHLSEQIVTSGKWSRYYRCLPGRTVDGINENGVVCEVNVVGGDPSDSWPTTGTVHCMGAVRWVLDHATDAGMAASNLVDHLFFPTGFSQNFHWMIADGTSTYIVENGTCSNVTGRAVMTNFPLVPEKIYGPGWERYMLLDDPSASITNAWYTRAYSRDTAWDSEFSSTDEMEKAKSAWETYGKDALRGKGLWQTVHTSVYDFENLTLRIAVQEADDWYVFSVDRESRHIPADHVYGRLDELARCELPYVESDGTNYIILTGVTLPSDADITLSCSHLSLTSCAIFGRRKAYLEQSYSLFISGVRLYFDFGRDIGSGRRLIVDAVPGSTVTIKSTYGGGNRHTTAAYVNGALYDSTNILSSSFSVENPALFYSFGHDLSPARCRFYGLTVRDSATGTPIHDIVPYYKGGTAGVFDRVTGTFYTTTTGVSLRYDEAAVDRSVRLQDIIDYLRRNRYTPSADDPAFSNAVLAVGVDTNILAGVAASTNAVAQIGAFYSAFADIGITPEQGGITLAGLLAALVAAVVWLKRNKIGKTDDIPQSQVTGLADALEAKQDKLTDPQKAVVDGGPYATDEGVDSKVENAKAELNARIDVIEATSHPNMSIVGTPTFTEGVVSGFSATDYLMFPTDVNVGQNAVDFYMAFTTGVNVTAQQNILDSWCGIAFAIQNGGTVTAASQNGTTFVTASSTGTISANTSYRLKLEFRYADGSYTIATYLATGSGDYAQIGGVVTLTAPVHPTATYWGGANPTSGVNHIFGGSINLAECRMDWNGKTVWRGYTEVPTYQRGVRADGSPVDQELHDFFAESNSLLGATIDARLHYPLNTDGTIKDRAINEVTSGAFVIPQGFHDLCIRYTGVPTSLTFSGTDASIADYGDGLPAETGDYLITVTRTKSAECYIRVVTLEARA